MTQIATQVQPAAQLGIVYVLTNPWIPELVKIGLTEREDAGLRIGELYTTGVHVPFKLQFACRVKNAAEVEKALHIAFGPDRINPKREFFRIDPNQAIAILKLLPVEDATSEIAQQPSGIDTPSIIATETARPRMPSLNFEQMKIPIGAILQSVDDDTTVVVVGPKKVKLGEGDMSLTAATRKVLGIDYSVAPVPHWTYNGRPLGDIYDETYRDDD